MPTIIVPAGQVNVKGPQAPTGIDRWISADSALTFAGLVLTIAITGGGTTITNAAGSLSYQGLVLDVRTGDQVIEVPAGSLIIKGPQRPQAVPQPLAGALTITGYAPGVAVDVPGSNITIAAGSLVVQGLAPDRLIDATLPIPAGVLTLTGQYVGVQFLQPAAGSLVWQGLAPSIGTQAIALAMPAGQVRWTGLAPSLVFAFTIPVPAGQLVLTGFQPNVGTPESIVLQVGSLVLAGQAPTFDQAFALPAGVLAYTGQALQLGIVSEAQTIPAGALVWQGYGPALVHSNGTVIGATVQIVRSVSGTGTIVRTVSSEVQR